MKNHQTIGFTLAVIGTFLFSLKSIFIKFAYLQGLNAEQVLLLRMIFSMPCYVLILVYLIHKKHTKLAQLSSHRILLISSLGFLGYYLASLLDLMSLELISAQLERLGLFTYPFMVAILGYLFFSEPLGKKLIFSLCVCYCGLIIVMNQESQLSENPVNWGTLLVLGSALSYSLYVLFGKTQIKQIGSLLFTCIAMISSSIMVFIHAYFTVTLDWSALNYEVWQWIILLALFSTVIPSFMMTEAIQQIGPSQTGVVGTLGPMFTIIAAVYWLDETFNLIMGLGVLMVILGVMSLIVKKTTKN